MRKKKFKFNPERIALIILAVVFVFSFVKAEYLSPNSINVEEGGVLNIETLNFGQLAEGLKETVLGAITMDTNTFDHGIDITEGGITITAGGLTVSAGGATITGNITQSNGTTTIDRSYDGYYVSGSLTAATGTATTTLSAWEVNIGQRRLCRDVVIDQTGNPDDKIYFSVSTSTYAGNEFTFNKGLIASSSIATATTDILSKEDDEGGDTREWWNWDNSVGVGIVMSPDALISPNGSSTDFDEVAGTWHIFCLDY